MKKKKNNIEKGNAKKRLLKANHINYIENLIDGNPWSRWIAADLKVNLEQEFEDIAGISKSTIIRCLKRDLNWSYKKLEKKPAPALTNDSLRSLLQVATIQNSIHDKGVEIIFIDEFSINTRHHRFCGWSKKNRRGYINIQSRDFSMSFIWAVSKMNV